MSFSLTKVHEIVFWHMPCLEYVLNMKTWARFNRFQYVQYGSEKCEFWLFYSISGSFWSCRFLHVRIVESLLCNRGPSNFQSLYCVKKLYNLHNFGTFRGPLAFVMKDCLDNPLNFMIWRSAILQELSGSAHRTPNILFVYFLSIFSR